MILCLWTQSTARWTEGMFFSTLWRLRAQARLLWCGRAAEPAMLKAILDMGPDGVIFPFVHNADTARLAVAACTYPDGPYQGVRGQGPMRAVRYGFGEEAAYLAAPENYLLKIMQIESYEGWLNLDEILSVPGVDGVYLGPADLGRSVAAHKDLNPPSVAEICDDVCRRVRAAGKWMGASGHYPKKCSRCPGAGGTVGRVRHRHGASGRRHACVPCELYHAGGIRYAGI